MLVTYCDCGNVKESHKHLCCKTCARLDGVTQGKGNSASTWRGMVVSALQVLGGEATIDAVMLELGVKQHERAALDQAICRLAKVGRVARFKGYTRMIPGEFKRIDNRRGNETVLVLK